MALSKVGLIADSSSLASANASVKFTVDAGSSNTNIFSDHLNVTSNTTIGGISTFTSTSKFQQSKEKITISATAATGTINYDFSTQAVLYYTTNASGNWTINVRGDGSNSLDSLMSVGESATVVFLATQGGTAYYNSAFQVDGGSVTPKWQGGSAPSAGTINSIDVYTYTIIKTGSATFTVLANLVDFG